MSKLIALLAALAAVPTTSSALAQSGSFPERPIRFVVPFAPGGGVDATARLIAQMIQDSSKKRVLLQCDRGVSHGTTVWVMDLAKQSGAMDISFIGG